jgi:hypothetical protein
MKEKGDEEMKNRLTVLVLALLVVGCGQKTPEQAATVPPPPQFVNVAPEGAATPIPEARKLEPGTDVVLTGRVMGIREPFVADRALFVLGDNDTITPCSEMGDDDHCAIPWDACCDPVAVRAAGTASIQLMGDNGKVLPIGLKGVNGLKELSKVTVAGTVAPGSTADAFVVIASAVFVGQ